MPSFIYYKTKFTFSFILVTILANIAYLNEMLVFSKCKGPSSQMYHRKNIYNFVYYGLNANAYC